LDLTPNLVYGTLNTYIKCCRQQDFLEKNWKNWRKKVNIAFVAYSTTFAQIHEGLGLRMMKEAKNMQCSQAQRDWLLACNLFLVKCYFTVNQLFLSNNQSRMKENYGGKNFLSFPRVLALD
jgi:hypothetical protein